jgi:hypothetical protein
MNRGGVTEHIYVRDVEMDDVKMVFEATMNWNPSYSYSVIPEEYTNKEIPEHWAKVLEEVQPDKGTPYFNDIYLSGFRVRNSKTFMSVEGSETSLMKNFNFSDIDAGVDRVGYIRYARDWKFDDINIRAKNREPVVIENSENVHFPADAMTEETDFPYALNGVSKEAQIRVATYPEFAFLLPEMAGNLKFGVVQGKNSKWLGDFEVRNVKQSGRQLTYRLSDPILKGGGITVDAVALNSSDGVIIEVSAKKIPDDISLFWSYGGACGKILEKTDNGSLKPAYCKDNVFSVEWTAFTLYYGQSMALKTINAVMPVSSEIRLSDAYIQQSPLSFFESGKKTGAPVLAATLPLINGQREYFCVYRQNEKADYNHYMLPALFLKEKAGKTNVY